MVKSRLLALPVLLLAFIAFPAFADTWGSDYDGASSFEIDSVEDLQAFANMVNNDKKDFSGKTVTLTADLNLSDVEWKAIGSITKSSAWCWFVKHMLHTMQKAF